MNPNDFRNEMFQIAADVFASVLQLDVVAGEPTDAAENSVSATVKFEGTWNGAAAVECSLKQGQEVVSRLMLPAGTDDLNEDISDAMGELTNIIGGNLRAVLPPKVSLSVPSVTFHSTPLSRQQQDGSVCTIHLQSELGPFSVSLVSYTAEADRNSPVH